MERDGRELDRAESARSIAGPLIIFRCVVDEIGEAKEIYSFLLLKITPPFSSRSTWNTIHINPGVKPWIHSSASFLVA